MPQNPQPIQYGFGEQISYLPPVLQEQTAVTVFGGTNVDILAGLVQARALNTKLVLSGTFSVTAAILLQTGDVIALDKAFIQLAWTGGMFTTVAQASNITVTGTGIFDGGSVGGFAGNGFLLTGCQSVLFDLDVVLQNWGNTKQFILANPSGTVQGNGLTIRGQITTGQPTVVRVNDWSFVDISGVQTPAGGATAAFSNQRPITYVSDATVGVLRAINIHDCQIDAGGLLNASGIINIKGTAGSDIVGVTCHDLILRNAQPVPSAGLLDGLDIANAVDVSVSGVTGDLCFDLVSVIGSRARVAGVVAENCSGAGVAVGDSSVQAENIADIVVSDCIALNCGQGSGTIGTGSGFVSNSTSGFTTDKVTFIGCRTRDTTGSAQKYGFRMIANGVGTNVQWIGGYMHGFTRCIDNAQDTTVEIRGAQMFNGTVQVHGVVIAAPFNTTDNGLGIVDNAGDTFAAAPVLATAYTVFPTKVHVSVVESGTGTLTWKDPLGTTKKVVPNNGAFEFDCLVGDTLTFATAQPTTLVISEAG